MTRLKIYVGCALSGAPPEFVARVQMFKKALRARDFEVINWYGDDGRPHPEMGGRGVVYDHDIWKGVGGCDLFVVIADEPSTGLGIELGAAIFYLVAQCALG